MPQSVATLVCCLKLPRLLPVQVRHDITAIIGSGCQVSVLKD